MLFENLKAALRRQRKLLLLFILTILAPAVILAVFGVRGVLLDKYRLEKQAESEWQNFADGIWLSVSRQLEVLGSKLESIVDSGLIAAKPDLFARAFEKNLGSDVALIDQAFFVSGDQPPVFLLRNMMTNAPSVPRAELPDSMKLQMDGAIAAEFQEKDYVKAAKIYQRILATVENPNLRARLLMDIARCQSAEHDLNHSLETYRRVAKEYEGTIGESGQPLAIIAQMRMSEIFSRQNEISSALNASCGAFDALLDSRGALTEDQYHAYSGMIIAAVESLLAKKGSERPEFRARYDKILGRHRERLDAWRDMAVLKDVLIPEMIQESALLRAGQERFLRISKASDDKARFVVAVLGPLRANGDPQTSPLLGALVDQSRVLEKISADPTADNFMRRNFDFTISDLAGRYVFGLPHSTVRVSYASNAPVNNFPLRIEFYRSTPGQLGFSFLLGSFYFWTFFLTLVILVSGTLLAARTIIRESDILDLKSGFVSAVSHDLKSPLASIKALVERLRDGKIAGRENLLEYFSMIGASTDQLLRQIDNILSFSRLESGKKVFRLEKTDVAALVRREIDAFEEGSRRGRNFIKTHIEEGIPFLDLDPEAVGQAVRNLLENAGKFSPESKEISLAVAKDAESVRITVRDEGIGIARDEQGRIFEKYYQGKDAARFSPSGVGLGLFIVREIAAAHRGRITVASDPGSGSAFSLVLPLPEAAEVEVTDEEDPDH